MSTSLGEGYVCLAHLDEHYRFITSTNEALRLELFESNVRDYAGSTSVNNAIAETLNPPSRMAHSVRRGPPAARGNTGEPALRGGGPPPATDPAYEPRRTAPR